MANRAFEFRIYPNRTQKELLARTFGCVRLVYNHYLDRKKQLWEKSRQSMSYNACSKDLTSLKKEKEFLKEVDSIALQQSLRHLDTAYTNFFKRKESGYPRFKSKRRGKQSYTTVNVNNNIRLEDGRIRLPKLGEVKIVLHRQVPQGAILKSVTIKREGSGKYYASLLCELPEPENQRSAVSTKEAKILGIDYAMQGMGVFSDGTKAEYPGYYRKAQERLAREQRKLSHCEKGSRNYEKQRKRVAICHEKIRHQREDYQHKMTRKLADQYDVVAVEDLDMKALSQCLHLGKGIMDNAYGAFLQKLSYKLEEQGKELIRIDRWYPSSQICSGCGSMHPEVKDLSVREWFCDHCLQYHDRDINAARNIREEGRWILSKRDARISA